MQKGCKITNLAKSRYTTIIEDWKAYFINFCAINGGDPIEYNGRWLFRTGWTYAFKDHKGPEWPPPEDPKELRKLQVYYWNQREKQLVNIRKKLVTRYHSLKQFSKIKSIPLQVKTKVWNDFEERYVYDSVELNFRDLENEIRMITNEIEECYTQLGLDYEWPSDINI